eukprot:UN09436
MFDSHLLEKEYPFNKRRGGWVGPMKVSFKLKSSHLTLLLENTSIWRKFFEPFNKQRG